MTGLRAIATAERTNRVRVLTSRYGVRTVGELIAAYNNSQNFTYLGYSAERSTSTITITSQSGESTKIDIGTEKITPEQRDQALEKIWGDVKKFFQDNWEDIESGKIDTADIGGALYGITASAILIIFVPFGALGPLLGAPFVGAATQQGRYWGAMVDEVLRVVKGESELKMKEIAGVLGTVIVAVNVSGLSGLVALGGVDAWNLTVEVGKKIGGTAADAIEKIGSVAGEIVSSVGSVGKDVIDFIVDLSPF